MFVTNAATQSIRNNNYRKVIYTNEEVQLVYMSLNIGEDIPIETHDGTQIFNIVSGRGMILIGRTRKKLSDGIVAVVPPYTEHYVKNTSRDEPLKFWTVYVPPEHPPKTIQNRQEDSK